MAAVGRIFLAVALVGLIALGRADRPSEAAQPTFATFGSASAAVEESLAAPSVEVKLSAAVAQEVKVAYSVSGGTATGGGVDYTLASGVLTFAAADTSENITLAIVDDSDDETD